MNLDPKNCFRLQQHIIDGWSDLYFDAPANVQREQYERLHKVSAGLRHSNIVIWRKELWKLAQQLKLKPNLQRIRLELWFIEGYDNRILHTGSIENGDIYFVVYEPEDPRSAFVGIPEDWSDETEHIRESIRNGYGFMQSKLAASIAERLPSKTRREATKYNRHIPEFITISLRQQDNNERATRRAIEWKHCWVIPETIRHYRHILKSGPYKGQTQRPIREHLKGDKSKPLLSTNRKRITIVNR